MIAAVHRAEARSHFYEGRQDMKTRRITYWVTTALLALGIFAGGAYNFARPPAVVQAMQHLGYPVYFAALLGAWKMSGALAVVAPGLPRLKEWAYAGMFFDLSGALVSHAAVGDGAAKLLPPIVLLVFALASWTLRPESRRLAAAHREALGESALGLEGRRKWLAS
jgi:uncharacterized membrane protein YphA (DoxX/SURF4 family)